MAVTTYAAAATAVQISLSSCVTLCGAMSPLLPVVGILGPVEALVSGVLARMLLCSYFCYIFYFYYFI